MHSHWRLIIIALILGSGCYEASADEEPAAAVVTAQPNLLSLFIVTKESDGGYRGILYPVATYGALGYRDASLDPDEGQLKDSVLNDNRSFTAVDQGSHLGVFDVVSVITEEFDCSDRIVGSFVTDGSLFDKMNEYTLNEYRDSIERNGPTPTKTAPALTNAPPHSPDKNTSKRRPEFARSMDSAIRSSLNEHFPKIISLGELDLKTVLDFDLDRDGQAESYVEAEQRIVCEQDTVLNFSVRTIFESSTYPETPQILWQNVFWYPELPEETVVPQWIKDFPNHDFDKGMLVEHLIGHTDINGDGVDEVVIHRSNYEYKAIMIYEYRDGKLVEVFEGASYGC